MSDKYALIRHFRTCHPDVDLDNESIFSSQIEEQSKKAKELMKANNAKEKPIKYQICPICGKLLSDKNCLMQHLKKIHPTTGYVYENENIPTSLLLQIHENAKKAEKKLIKCRKCYKNVKHLRLHLKNKHPGVKALDDTKRKISSEPANVKALNQLAKLSSSGNTNVSSKNDKNVNNYNKMYYCHMCKTAEIDLKTLKIHISNDHKTMEPIKCEQCEDTFMERYSQMKHFEKFHPQLYYQYYQKFADFFNQTGVVTNDVRKEENDVPKKDERSVTNFHRNDEESLPNNVHSSDDNKSVHEDKREIYKCEKCSKCFGTHESLVKHVTFFHENFQLSNNSTISNIIVSHEEEKNVHEGQNYLLKPHPTIMEFVPPASNDTISDMDIAHEGEKNITNPRKRKQELIPMETDLPPINSKKAKILLPNKGAIGKKLRVLLPKVQPEPREFDTTKVINQEFDPKNQNMFEEHKPKVIRVLMPEKTELLNGNPLFNEMKFKVEAVQENNTTIQQLYEMNKKIENDYSKETNLQRHMRAVATGIKRYNCYKCGKFQFMTSENASAQIHMNTCHRGITHIQEGKKT